MAILVTVATLLTGCSDGGGGDAGSRSSTPTTTGDAGAVTTSPVTPGPPATVVSRGDPTRQIVALTFDAGADTGFTADILDTLGRERVRATFGITGKWAEENPDLVRRMANEGYQIVNHTYDHSSFTGRSSRQAPLDESERRNQIERTETIIHGLTGQTTRPWYRPPYGDYDEATNVLLGQAGYRYNAMWTVDSLGWTGLSAQQITDRCLKGNVPGAIHLFHVGAQSQDAAALPGIIAALRQSGYSFGTLSEVTGLQ